MKILKLNIHMFEDEIPVPIVFSVDDKEMVESSKRIEQMESLLKNLDDYTKNPITFKMGIDLKDFTPKLDYVKSMMGKIFEGSDKTQISGLMGQIADNEQIAKATKDMENMQDVIQNMKQQSAKGLVNDMIGDVDMSKVQDLMNQYSQNETSFKVRAYVDTDLLEQQLEQLRGNFGDTAEITSHVAENMENLKSKFPEFAVEVGNASESAKDLGNNIQDVGNKAPDATDKLNQMTNGLSKLKDKTDSLSSSFKTLLSSLGIQTSFAGIVAAMKQGVLNTADYTESVNLFKMSFDDLEGKASQWSKTISEALYLDDAEVMKFAGSFNNLTKGLGASADAAYLMSTNLTQLTFDMASYLNISNEAAYTKLMSAMSGQTKAVTNVGIAVKQASLEELAHSYNIKKSVASMTEAEKTYLRYIQIMNSTKHMQGDLGRTIVTPANAFRMLKTQMTLFARAVGNVLIPIIYAAMPPLIALTRLLTDLAKKLAAMVGIKIPDVDYDNIKGIQKQLNKTGKEADKTKKKLTQMLAPFDELNVVENQGSGSGDDEDSIIGTLDGMLDGYNMLKDLNKEMAKQISEWEEKLKDIAKWLGIIAGVLAGLKVLKFFGDIGGAVVNIANAAKVLGGTKLGSMFGNLISSIKGFDLINWAKNFIIAWKFDTIANEGAGALHKFGSKLTLIHDSIGKVGQVLSVVGLIINLVDSFKKGSEECSDFAAGANIVTAAISGWMAFGPIGGVVGAALSGIATAIGGLKKQKDVDEKAWKDYEKTFGESVTNMAKQFAKFKINPNMIIDDKVIEDTKTSVENLANTITNTIKTKKEEQENVLKTMFERGGISEEEYNNSMKSVDNYHQGLTDRTENARKEINDILAKYNGKKEKMTDEDRKRMLELQKELNKTSIDIADEGTYNRLKIASKLSGELYDINTQTASEIIKEALNTKNETIKAADEQYAGEIAAAKTMFKAGTINEETYNKMVEDARKTHDDTVREANEQYDEIYNGFKENNEDIAKYIDKDDGHVKSKWEIFWNGIGDWFHDKLFGKDGNGGIVGWFKELPKKIGDAIGGWWDKIKGKWQEFKDDFQRGWEEITHKSIHIEWVEGKKATGWVKDVLEALNLPTSIPKPKFSYYAQGGYPTSGEMFMMNENGPEFLTTVGNRTAVVNQDQMAQAVAAAVADVAKAITNTNQKPGNTVIYLGNDKLYEGQGTYQSRQTDRYGTSVINI